MATTIISISGPFGIVFGQGITPLFVATYEYVPIMILVWFVPIFAGAALAFCAVNASVPPLPPTQSAATMQVSQCNSGFLNSIGELMRNKAFLILAVVIGGSNSYLTALQALNESIMCSLGYSNKFSGMMPALGVICGVFGAFVMSHLLPKTINLVTLVKVVAFAMLTVALGLSFTMRTTDAEIPNAILSALLGLTVLG